MDIEVHPTVEVLVGKQGLFLGGLGYLLAPATPLVVAPQEYLPESQQQDLKWRENGINEHHLDYLLTNITVPLLVEIIVNADEHFGYKRDLDLHGRQ